MGTWRLMQLAVMLLVVGSGAAKAFDLHDIRQLRDSGYRWCRQCDLSRIQLQDADLSGAQLQNADLSGAQLQNADLSGAQLQNADLRYVQLQNAKLLNAQLQDADLSYAQLQNANLVGANLQDANLVGAQLQNADLFSAQLNEAHLVDGSVEGAKLDFANLTNATYAPASPPPNGHMEGIQGLSTLRVPYDEATQQARVSGLVLLRELLQKAGLRDLEREATFSIERAKTQYALDRWRERPLRAAEAVARLIFFEWPVAYGLDPWRASLILLGLMLLLSFVYVPAIGRTGRSQSRRGAIYQIWPNERLIDDGDGTRLATYGDMPERLRAHRLKAKSLIGQYGYALYFSLLSAFHIGWRELNVGTWLARLQRQEYTLRPLGWPRMVSGLQSLISVYLVAIWALTYFGRPFQ
jgi:hypothetical protein